MQEVFTWIGAMCCAAIGFIVGTLAQKNLSMIKEQAQALEINTLRHKLNEQERWQKAWQEATSEYVVREINNGIARATHE